MATFGEMAPMDLWGFAGLLWGIRRDPEGICRESEGIHNHFWAAARESAAGWGSLECSASGARGSMKGDWVGVQHPDPYESVAYADAFHQNWGPLLNVVTKIPHRTFHFESIFHIPSNGRSSVGNP